MTDGRTVAGRRSVLRGLVGMVVAGPALLAIGLSASPARAQAVPPGFQFSQKLTYRIYRGDKRIGQTVFEYYTRGTDSAMVTRTSIDVQVMVYSYSSQHVATEVWENGELTLLETTTNDDGTPFQVEGSRGPDGFRVTGSEGAVVVPPGTPPKSFWNAGILQAGHVITTKRGAVARVKTTTLGRERVAFKGGATDATRYKFESDDVIDLWYTDDGLLVKALRDSFGGDILYLLDTTGG